MRRNPAWGLRHDTSHIFYEKIPATSGKHFTSYRERNKRMHAPTWTHTHTQMTASWLSAHFERPSTSSQKWKKWACQCNGSKRQQLSFHCLWTTRIQFAILKMISSYYTSFLLLCFPEDVIKHRSSCFSTDLFEIRGLLFSIRCSLHHIMCSAFLFTLNLTFKLLLLPLHVFIVS